MVSYTKLNKIQTVVMSKRKKKTTQKATKLAVTSFFAVLIFTVGVALDVLYCVLPFFKSEGGALWGKVCIYGGIALTAVGLVMVIVCIALYRRADKKEALAKKQRMEMLEKQAEALANAQSEGVTYVPAQEAANIVTVGAYQTLEEKFDQISKMDKTQFVIYVARLFSRKGYQVKLTPVIDNHDIDLLVEKMGVTIAVGCLISSRILTKDDIVRVRDGRLYYNVNNCMALTNMYFDRTALEYAQVERISLVDRNLLADDFMN